MKKRKKKKEKNFSHRKKKRRSKRNKGRSYQSGRSSGHGGDEVEPKTPPESPPEEHQPPQTNSQKDKRKVLKSRKSQFSPRTPNTPTPPQKKGAPPLMTSYLDISGLMMSLTNPIVGSQFHKSPDKAHHRSISHDVIKFDKLHLHHCYHDNYPPPAYLCLQRFSERFPEGSQ